MNAKHMTLGGWVLCALTLNSMADSATLSGLWHAPQVSLAVPSACAVIAGTTVSVRVGGCSSDVLRSTDTIHWTCHSSGTLSSLYAIAFGCGRFVAVGNEGAVVTSTDGATWMVLNSPTDERLRSIVFAKGLFLAVGYNGTIITSADGVTWTTHKSKTDDRLQAVSYGNDRFLAVSKNGHVLASRDGKRWNLASDVRGIFTDLAYENNTFTAGTIEGASFTSGDGVVWTAKSALPAIASAK